MRLSKIISFVILFLGFCSAIPANADRPNIILTADTTSASINDAIPIQISVEGKAFVGRPEIDGLDNFNVRGSGTSSQMQIINGQISSSKLFHYILMPKGTGKFTIGPASIDIGGKRYISNTVTLNIFAERAAPPGGAVERPILPDESVDKSAARERDAYMTASVSNKKPFIGEQLVYTLRFYTTAPMQNAQLNVPDFQGFIKEQLGDVVNTQKVIDGRLWHISELRFALYPIEAGELTIEAAQITADMIIPMRPPSIFSNPLFNSFHDTERKTYVTSPVTLVSKPLPHENRPSGFTGLVGKFTLSQTISKKEAEVGDSLTLTTKIEGMGDLAKLPPPKIINNNDFKIYDDDPVTESTPTANGLKKTKTFKKAIVPLKAGELTIPKTIILYFDPNANEYVELMTDPINLDIKPSSNPEQIIVSSGKNSGILKQELTVLGDDLAPLIKDATNLKRLNHMTNFKIVCILIAISAFAAFLIAVIIYRRAEKLRADSGYLRRGRALKLARKNIRKLGRARGSDFAADASYILRDYLGNKLNIDGRAITPADLTRKLEPAGISIKSRESTRNILENCDSVLYGGREFSDAELKNITGELSKLVKKLEKEFQK